MGNIPSNCGLPEQNDRGIGLDQAAPEPTPVSRGMVRTSLCSIGYITTVHDDDEIPMQTPVVCFHSSPRSSDEYLELLPALSMNSDRQVIAIDTPGYGISENPKKSCSIDDVADAFLQVVDALNVDKFVVLGSLMGNLMAVSLASRYPKRVVACICSNLYYYPKKMSNRPSGSIAPNKEGTPEDDAASVGAPDATKKPNNGTSSPNKSANGKNAPITDAWELQKDGSHLVDLHNRRKWLDSELNLRVVQSELTYLVNRRMRYAKGISIQDLTTFDFEKVAPSVNCPTLCIKGNAAMEFFDAIGFQGTQQFETGCKLFPKCHEVVSVSGPRSTINMINQEPEVVAELCAAFLHEQNV